VGRWNVLAFSAVASVGINPKGQLWIPMIQRLGIGLENADCEVQNIGKLYIQSHDRLSLRSAHNQNKEHWQLSSNRKKCV
jgi:hypothetical protein